MSIDDTTLGRQDCVLIECARYDVQNTSVHVMGQLYCLFIYNEKKTNTIKYPKNYLIELLYKLLNVNYGIRSHTFQQILSN